MKDTNGREYLKLAEAKDGQQVELDNGFTCQKPGKYKLSCDEISQLPYFPCCDGRHYLAGQVEKGYVIGVYPV